MIGSWLADQARDGVLPGSGDADVAAHRAAIAGFTAPPGRPSRLHFAFGTLSDPDCDVLAHKHLDDHHRQFGC